MRHAYADGSVADFHHDSGPKAHWGKGLATVRLNQQAVLTLTYYLQRFLDLWVALSFYLVAFFHAEGLVEDFGL